MTLSITTMFRNEAPYLREWIEFYRMQGVTKFYLYNNLSTDDWECVLLPYRMRDIVEVIDWPHPPGFDSAILNAIDHCMQRLKGRTGWLAVFDIDEFVFPLNGITLAETIQSYPQSWGAIGVSMTNFGAGEEVEWRDAPVIERFTWRPRESNHWNEWVKSIVNLSDPGLGPTGSGHHYRNAGGTFNELGVPIDGPKSPWQSSILRMNHYFTKSRGEWEKRHPVVTDGSTWPRNESRWSEVQDKDVDDRTIWKFLPELKRRLA